MNKIITLYDENNVSNEAFSKMIYSRQLFGTKYKLSENWNKI